MNWQSAGNVRGWLGAGLTALLLFAVAQMASARSVTLAWDANNTEPDLDRYRLHYGTVSTIYTQVIEVGKDLHTATVSNLDDATTYFFVVTAVNTSELESLASNEVVSASVPNQLPAVSLSSPANQTSFTAPGNIPLTATASDSDGTIVKVEFFNGATKIGEALTPPFVATWSNVPEGVYQVAAVAHDNMGAWTRSTEVSIRVRRLAVNAMHRNEDGTFELTVQGAEGQTAYVEVSDDLETWGPLTSAVIDLISGSVVITDPEAATKTRRFYRVSSD